MSKYGEVMYVVFVSNIRVSQEYVPEVLDLVQLGACPLCMHRHEDDSSELPIAGSSRKYICDACGITTTVEAWETTDAG